MTTEIQTTPQTQAIQHNDLLQLSRDQIDLLKRTVAKGTSDDEFKLFLEVCKRRKVDPFSKLLYPVKRYDSKERMEVMTVQSSIDYFRLTAERNGRYAGQVGPQWCGEDGVWKDVWLSKDAPAAARVGIMRHDFKEPLYGVALWSNYVQRTKEGSPTKFWSSMGPLMLGKCAEALAIRRAFPEDLAGLYTPEEMEQAETPALPAPDPKTGEVKRHLPPTPPAKPQAARTVDTTAVVPPKPPSRPAPSQEPRKEAPQEDGIDPQAVPEQGQDGWVYQGLPISDKIAKGFESYWGRYPAVKDDSKMKDLVGYTWAQLTEGSPGGKRERALRFVVARARDEWLGQGKMPIEWSMKAAWTLNVMYQRHASDDMAAANGLGRRDEDPMPSGTLFNGESDETPF